MREGTADLQPLHAEWRLAITIAPPCRGCGMPWSSVYRNRCSAATFEFLGIPNPTLRARGLVRGPVAVRAVFAYRHRHPARGPRAHWHPNERRRATACAVHEERAHRTSHCVASRVSTTCAARGRRKHSGRAPGFSRSSVRTPNGGWFPAPPVTKPSHAEWRVAFISPSNNARARRMAAGPLCCRGDK